MNLEKYLERIGCTEIPKCDLNSLRSIQFGHATSIPFENLDPLCGKDVSLNIDAIQFKLVEQKRGGYCFEQNALLAAALREVGFAVDELSARVWYNALVGVAPPLTHVFLAVSIDNCRWLVDCGVGGSTPTGIMPLDQVGVVEKMLGEERRIIALNGRLTPAFMHQVLYEKEWKDVYEFSGERLLKIDQEVGNWWTNSYPDSKFRKNLMVGIINLDGTRYSIVNNKFVHRGGSKIIEEIIIKSREHLTLLLNKFFKLQLPNETNVDFLFQ